MASPSPSVDPHHLLEITLISAQDLKSPPSPSAALRRLHAFALVSIPSLSTPRLRTRVDRLGSANPTWNDRFLFRLPLPLLSPDSSAALSVDIFAHAGFLLPDSPLGSARILLSNLRLLDRPRQVPSFLAVGIRRRSGRFRGVLNVAFTLLSRVSVRAAEALAGAQAVGYRDLMGPDGPALKEINRAPTPIHPKQQQHYVNKNDKPKEKEEEDEHGPMQLCGFGGMKRRIHLSPSDENFQLSCSNADRDNKT